MAHRIVALIAFAAVPALSQPQLQFVASAGQKVAFIVPLPNTSPLFVGTNTISGGIAVWASGPSAFANTIKLGGTGTDVPQAAVVDGSGNIWIAGTTTSDDFPLVNAIVSKKVASRTAGFVMELNSNASAVLFATYLSGQGECSSLGCASYASAIAVDASGVYVGGSTDESDFPITRPRPLNGGPSVDSFGDQFLYSWVAKISPAGKLVYSFFLGTGGASCIGGSSCIGHSGTTAKLDSILVDSAGVTAVESQAIGAGRILRLTADGSKLLWSTSLGSAAGGASKLSLAEDAAGNIDVFGTFAPLTQPGAPQFGTGTPGLFSARLDSAGTLLYRTDFGQSPGAHPYGILLDSSGSVWLAGSTSSTSSALLAGGVGVGPDFLIQLNSAGSATSTLLRFPSGVISGAPILDSQHRLLIPGTNGALLTLPEGYAGSTPAVVGFANSASLGMNTGLYPGALISIFGFGLPDKPGPITIAGTPATVLYASSNQINLQVPFEVPPSGTRAALQLPLLTGTATVQLPIARSLGIFTVDGTYAAALNEDGTVNSQSKPSMPGSIVTFYGTGAIWPSGLTDGGIPPAAAPFDQTTNGLQIVDSTGVPGNISYAGAAPQLINGVFQLNAAIPAGAKPPFTLQSLTTDGKVLSSNPFNLW